jgi:nucleotidyltransferase substrate binding protein (TIGR01987 family)
MPSSAPPRNEALPAASRNPERWLQRFANFEKVLSRLEGHLHARADFRDPDLLAGLVLRHYAFCFELAWKSLRDLLAWNGIDAKQPRQVIKQAFATGVIINGQLWIDMLDNRPQFTADGDLEGDDGSDDARAQLAIAARVVAEAYIKELQAFRDNLAARREDELQEQNTKLELAP